MAFSVSLTCAVKISRTVTAHSEILCQTVFERATFITINADQNGLGCGTDISKRILAELSLPSFALRFLLQALFVLPLVVPPAQPLPLPEGQQQQDLGLSALCFSQGHLGRCHWLKTWAEGKCRAGAGAQALPGRCS